MSVSIADMERVALGGESLRMDEGSVIELGDLSDDLGLNLLMNPGKSGGGGQSQRTFTVPSQNEYPPRPQNEYPPRPQNEYPPRPQQNPQVSFGGSLGGIEVTPLEPLEPISIGVEPIDMNSFGGPPVAVSVNKESYGGMFGNSQSSTGPGIQLASPARDPDAEKKEKTDYLNKLQRLEAKGFPVSRKYTMDNSLDEVKTEYFRLVDARQLETSIKFQRQMLMGAITGMEWLNGRFDPFDMKLDGWSESVHENVEDFDEIFEELYDKYKDRGKMSPEMRLLMAVGGSGFMCHVSNSFFRSKMPSMDDVLKKNPELARQMAAAAASQAGPGFGNFMGMAMGVQPPMPQGPSYSNGPQSPYPGNGGPQAQQTGGFFGASAAPEYATPRPSARREMAGPSDVDDILKSFDDARRLDAASTFQAATGVLTQPAVAAVMSSSMSVAESQAESARTGATNSLRPRRKRAQPPVGNTVSLDA